MIEQNRDKEAHSQNLGISIGIFSRVGCIFGSPIFPLFLRLP